MPVTIAAVMTVWLAMTSLAAGVQRAPQRIPPIGIESMTGRDSFSFYCSPCHGSDGKGNGPVAAALQTAPPDLTLLSRHAGGTFPRSHVQEFVTGTGRPVPAHGSGDMPVWGPIFRSLDPSDARVKVRIVNLVEFLETIQAR